MYRSLALLSFALLVSPLTLAQSNTDCRRIAAATVAELRAGYEGWSEEAEQLARTAAGAACVKATLSVQTRAAGSTPGSLDSAVVPAAGAPAAGTPAAGAAGAGMAAGSPAAGPAAVAQAEDQSGEAEEDKTEEKESSESWSPFSDIKFNKVSARPGKKPYERRRESLDEED